MDRLVWDHMFKQIEGMLIGLLLSIQIMIASWNHYVFYLARARGDLQLEARDDDVEYPAELAPKFAGLGQTIIEKLMNDDPNRIFEVYCDKGIELRVRDVLEQTVAACRMLMGKGIQKGDVVILYSLVNEWVTPLTFACYIIGAPVNFFDTRFEEDEITNTLKLLQPTAIIYESKYKDRLFTALQQIKLPKLRLILNMEVDVALGGAVEIDTFQLPDIGDPTELAATLMLTSGTTGFPKVVQLSHAMMVQGVYNWWRPSPGRIFCFTSLHSMSQVSLMMHPVFFGTQRFYTPLLSSGSQGRNIVDKFKVTHYFSNPSWYLSVLKAAAESNDPSSLGSLRIALVGGDIVSESLSKFATQVAPRCKLMKVYGMTEMAGCVTIDEETGRYGLNGGILKSNFRAKILDDNDYSLGPNQMGRLFLKSSLPSLGYLGNNKANRETFVEDGWYNTGDYGYLDSDRLITIFTRYKNLVRSGNTVVIPNIVENIVNNHSSVLESVFVGHPLKPNDVDEVGTVFVVPQDASPPESIENDLRELLNQALQKDELRVVKFIRVMTELPLTSSGKINRMALKDIARGM